MKNIPVDLILEKNKLAAVDPWILLLHISLVNPTNHSDTAELFLARNPTNVVFGGNTYVAFPFEIDPQSSSSKGEFPSVTVRVSNITQVIQADIEKYNGGTGSVVELIVVNTAHLAADFAELTVEFEIQSCETDAQWITLTLAGSNPLNKRFPLCRYLPMHCNWLYKGAECGYSGALPSCDRTYTDCVAHSNTPQFGGFMGLRPGGIRVVL